MVSLRKARYLATSVTARARSSTSTRVKPISAIFFQKREGGPPAPASTASSPRTSSSVAVNLSFDASETIRARLTSSRTTSPVASASSSPPQRKIARSALTSLRVITLSSTLARIPSTSSHPSSANIAVEKRSTIIRRRNLLISFSV
ncbi:MAG: hypothetical protein C0608_09075 [Deltaproteobacteria bacterium]|nr:MAG: hypothetical protein C0608_09075 [Deltaproteobacteria bacterium]